MKKYPGVLGIVSTVVAVIALLSASAASFCFLYQPKAPRCLK